MAALFWVIAPELMLRPFLVAVLILLSAEVMTDKPFSLMPVAVILVFKSILAPLIVPPEKVWLALAATLMPLKVPELIVPPMFTPRPF